MECPTCRAHNEPGTGRCRSCGGLLTGLTSGSVLARRYEILRPLGEGGMGAVFKAHDRALDEVVALKVLRPSLPNTLEQARLFRSEIKLARKVSHRNVCRIYEYGEDGDLSYVAMEYVDGTNLRQAVRGQEGLPEEQAFEIALQVCRGLQAIHDVGIIHRDLKTANIMQDSRGIIRLMDFGIAVRWGDEAAGEGRETGTITGTPEYMSPEQARNQRLDFQSDIYSLGVVLFELFTGELPFQADHPMGILVQHVLQPPPLDSRLPSYLAFVLRKALAKDPRVRYATARGVAADLRLGRRPVGARAPAPIRRAGPPGSEGADRPRTPPAAEGTPTPLRRIRGSVDEAVRARIEALVPGLRDPEEAVRWKTAVMLCQVGPPAHTALPALMQALADVSVSVSDAAAEAIKSISVESPGIAATGAVAPAPSATLPPPPLVQRLVDALKNQDDASARWSAAVALGELGPRGREVVPALMEALDDIDDTVRWAAAVALGKIGPAASEAVRALAAVLSDPSDPVIRRHAATALGHLGPAARAAIPGLIGAFRIREVDVREEVADALVRIGASAVPALLEALNDDDERVRFEAADALTRIGVGYRPA